MKNLKTIEIDAIEHKNSIAGPYYFKATIKLNRGLKDEKLYTLSDQFGRCDHYITVTHQLLIDKGYIPNNCMGLWNICKEMEIKLIATKTTKGFKI